MRALIALLLLFATDPTPVLGQPQPDAAMPDCPAEELSCGKQTPIASDGVRPFENSEMGLRATFPAGSLVCFSRSGDAPRGFYAWYGATVAGCPEQGDIPASYMGLSSSWNALDYTSLRQAAGDTCRPVSPSVARRLRGPPLRIDGRPSRLCQWPVKGERIELSVYAMAGGPPGGPPRVVYFASLGSTPKRLDEDLAMFRAFLAAARIGLPDDEPTAN